MATLATAAAWLQWGGVPSAGPARRPDIILVVWDTCRPDRLSRYGHTRPTTPHLDAFAADAVTFRNAFSPAPWTGPSHASLFTGLLPSHHGLIQASGPRSRVLPGIPLLAETLAAAGYETVGVSCNPLLSDATGLDAGFSTMEAAWSGDEVKGTGRDAMAAVRRWLSARAQRKDARRRPVFLFVNLMETHLPRHPGPGHLEAVTGTLPDEDADRAARDIDERTVTSHTLGLQRVEPRVLAALVDLYDGTCHEVDAVTADLFAALDAEGLLRDSLVVVTSDHGEDLGEHGHLGHRLSVHDTLLHVPLVVRWPGRLDGGRTESAQVGLQDLYPTILEAARLRTPMHTGVDASSLAASPLPSRTLVAELAWTPLPPGVVAARLSDLPREALEPFSWSFVAVREPGDRPGARKYIKVVRGDTDPAGWAVREELYDLSGDPGELHDLMAKGTPENERDALRRLRERLPRPLQGDAAGQRDR